MILQGMALMTILNVSKAAIAFVLSFVVAREVSPSDYGLIAFAIPLTALLTLLTDLGMASAIIREQNLTKNQAGSAVSFMLWLGIIGGGVLVLSANWIERWTDIIGLAKVISWFGLVTCFSIWATTPRALLERNLNYQAVSAIEAIGLLLAVAGFGLAIHSEMGVMALVCYHLILQLIRALLFIFASKGLFKFSLVPKEIKSLIRTGGWVLVANLLAYAARNIDRFIIGAILGASALGVYSFAYQIMTVPLVLISWPASGVLLSLLSRVSEINSSINIEVLRRNAVLSFLGLAALISFPLMTYFIFGFEFILNEFFSNQWAGVNEYVQILAPIGALQSLASFSGAVLISNGDAKLNFRFSALNCFVITAAFLASVYFGLDAVVLAYAIASLVISTVMLLAICRSARVGALDFLNALLPAIVSSGIGAGVLLLLFSGEVGGFVAWFWRSVLYCLIVVLIFIFFRNEIVLRFNFLKTLKLSYRV